MELPLESKYFWGRARHDFRASGIQSRRPFLITYKKEVTFFFTCLFLLVCLLYSFEGNLNFFLNDSTPCTTNLPPLSPNESSLPWRKLFATCSLINCIYLHDLMFLKCLPIHWLQDLPFQNRRFPWNTALPTHSNTDLLLTLKLKL